MNDIFALVAPKFALGARNVGEVINNQKLNELIFDESTYVPVDTSVVSYIR